MSGDMSNLNYEANFNSYEREVVSLLQETLGLVSQSADNSRVIQWLTHKNLASSSSEVIKSTPGKVFAFVAYNKSNNHYWLQLFDLARPPNSTDAVAESYPVFAGTCLILDAAYFGVSGARFNTGIVFGISSTSSSFVAAPLSIELHVKYS